MHVIHLSHHDYYNIVLTLAVLALLWVIIYLVSSELAQRVPVELIAPR
jgi:hypothetical protein